MLVFEGSSSRTLEPVGSWHSQQPLVSAQEFPYRRCHPTATSSRNLEWVEALILPPSFNRECVESRRVAREQ
jgi:hypothetical protein